MDAGIAPVAGRSRSSSEANTSGDKQVPRGNGLMQSTSTCDESQSRVQSRQHPNVSLLKQNEVGNEMKPEMFDGALWLAFRYGKEMEILSYAIQR